MKYRESSLTTFTLNLQKHPSEVDWNVLSSQQTYQEVYEVYQDNTIVHYLTQLKCTLYFIKIFSSLHCVIKGDAIFRPSK